MKLRVKLYNEGNIVIYRVLWQCETITCHDGWKGDNMMLEVDGFKVVSCIKPDIPSRNEIHIRGYDRRQDDRVTTVVCYSEKDAIKYVQDMLRVLDKFAKGGYFKGKNGSALDDTIEDYVYEF